MHLPRNYWFAKDKTGLKSQFGYLNRRLGKQLDNNPMLRQELGLTEENVKDLLAGRNIRGFTWHHHQQFGRMQLVPTSLHQQIGHVGGRHIWGGGDVFRSIGKLMNGEYEYPNSNPGIFPNNSPRN